MTLARLKGVKGAPRDGRIWGFAPRFVRGGRPVLSNHAWGRAFDVNYQWNRLATVPALRNEKGSVRDLVPIAVAATGCTSRWRRCRSEPST